MVDGVPVPPLDLGNPEPEFRILLGRQVGFVVLVPEKLALLNGIVDSDGNSLAFGLDSHGHLSGQCCGLHCRFAF